MSDLTLHLWASLILSVACIILVVYQNKICGKFLRERDIIARGWADADLKFQAWRKDLEKELYELTDQNQKAFYENRRLSKVLENNAAELHACRNELSILKSQSPDSLPI